MAVGAASGEDLEASSNTAGVPTSEVSKTGPVHVSVVSSYVGNLVFITLDSPEGSDIVSVKPALGLLISVHLAVHEAESSGSDSVHDRLLELGLPSPNIPCLIIFDLAH
jgi:hypothetical protein